MLTVEDLSSSAGTYVNGRRINRAVVSPNDEIKLADVITLDWEHPVLVQWLSSQRAISTKSTKQGLNPLAWILPSTALLTALIVVLSTGGFSGASSSGSGSGLIDSRGVVHFTDGGTGEPVEITVVDEYGRALQGIQVDFVDGDGFETFVAFDPQSGSPPSLRVFPHNSSHEIEMLTETVVPMIKEVIPGSDYYESIMAFADILEDFAEGEAEPASYQASAVPDNWIYFGSATQEELDQQNQLYLMLLKPIPKIGATAAQISETGGRILDILDAANLIERPDEYHVFVINPSSGHSENMAGSIFFTMPVEQEWDVSSETGTDALSNQEIPLSGAGSLIVHQDEYDGTTGNSLDEVTASLPDRFTQSSTGVITDHVTGLQWYVLNYSGYFWDDRYQEWCEVCSMIRDLGPSWRLPSEQEVAELFNAGVTTSNRGLFLSNAYWLWCGSMEDSSDFSVADIYDGEGSLTVLRVAALRLDHNSLFAIFKNYIKKV